MTELQNKLDKLTWQPIETAPKDKRVLVWTGQEIYAAHWVQHPITGDEAWLIAEWGDGDQALVHPTHWTTAPQLPHHFRDLTKKVVNPKDGSYFTASTEDGKNHPNTRWSEALNCWVDDFGVVEGVVFSMLR